MTIPIFDDIAPSLSLDEPAELYGPNLADYNNDGRLDVLATNHNDALALFHQEPSGELTDVAADAGIGVSDDKHGAAWGDCDDDGLLDLYIAVGADRGLGSNPKHLYLNEGNGTFIDVASTAGVEVPLLRGTAASWVDFDNDGHLDLFVNARERPGTSDALFRNVGGCQFEDVSATAGALTDNFHVFGASWADYDNDGDMDVLASAPARDGGSDLFRNDDGVFVAVSVEAGITRDGARGVAWGDYDNDGNMDLFLTDGYLPSSTPRPSRNRLYHNNGDGTFTEEAESAGVSAGLNSQEAVWADFDNDGLVDLFVVNAGTTLGNEPDLLFQNRGDGTFLEVGGELNVKGSSAGLGGGAAVGDFDSNGFPDLFVTNGGVGSEGAVGPHELLLNSGNSNRWLGIVLKGRESNHFGIGARVELTTSDGTRQIREVNGGVHRWSQDEMRIIFGLGQDTEMVQLIVRWPSGIVQHLNDVTSNESIEIVELSTTP